MLLCNVHTVRYFREKVFTGKSYCGKAEDHSYLCGANKDDLMLVRDSPSEPLYILKYSSSSTNKSSVDSSAGETSCSSNTSEIEPPILDQPPVLDHRIVPNHLCPIKPKLRDLPAEHQVCIIIFLHVNQNFIL